MWSPSTTSSEGADNSFETKNKTRTVVTGGAGLEAVHLLNRGGAEGLDALSGELAVTLVELHLVLGLPTYKNEI